MLVLKKLKNLIINSAQCFSGFIPKRKNLWVFGSWSGKLYADNSKYLFEYINQHHPEIDAVWITRDKEIQNELSKKGYNCFMRFSAKGILSAIRAEAAFITSDEVNDISPFASRKRTRVISLWHGIAAKGFNWTLDKYENKARTEKAFQRFREYYWAASSDEYIRAFGNALKIPKERFVVTGYPRNDTFVTKPNNHNLELLKEKYPNDKFVIYMPTHREYGKRPIEVREFDLIDQELRRQNVIMVYKPHFNELRNLNGYESHFTNIIVAKDQKVWGDVYSYIHYFDLLISDYSSIVYDFLCADKPIVLYTYDLDHFKSHDFGLTAYFDSLPVGPVCFTWDEVLKNMSSLLIKDIWKEKRNECRKVFHPQEDGHNSERVFNAAVAIINSST